MGLFKRRHKAPEGDNKPYTREEMDEMYKKYYEGIVSDPKKLKLIRYLVAGIILFVILNQLYLYIF